jgi:hypothetical protein
MLQDSGTECVGRFKPTSELLADGGVLSEVCLLALNFFSFFFSWLAAALTDWLCSGVELLHSFLATRLFCFSARNARDSTQHWAAFSAGFGADCTAASKADSNCGEPWHAAHKRLERAAERLSAH